MRTSFSESPFHFEARDEADTLKKVVLPCVATALASIVLPVPGGPNMRMPFHGRRMPLKKAGMRMGSSTASCSSFFVSSRSAMSSNCTCGFLSSTSRSSIWIRSASGPTPSG